MSSKKAEYSLEQNVNILHPKAVELEGWFRIYGLPFHLWKRMHSEQFESVYGLMENDHSTLDFTEL